jgi:predicted phage terminase large subunit-like protein
MAMMTTNGKIKAPKHLILLNEALLEITGAAIQNLKANEESGAGQNLLVFMPPRHGKSELISRFFPAWLMTMFPEIRVMLASYEAAFAASWGRKARDAFEFWAPMLKLRVTPGAASADWWEVQRIMGATFRNTGGAMYTAGVGGSLTGKGGNIIIIDDPIKNAESAMSPLLREKAMDWYLSTLSTRLEPNASQIIVHTRWHTDDLGGRILEAAKENGEVWRVIDFPALAMETDVLGREAGEALWPDRFSAEKLHEVEKKMGPYWFSAMYQQQPIPEGKSVFQKAWLGRWEKIESIYKCTRNSGEVLIFMEVELVIFQTVDLATSLKQTADYTVISTWGKTPTGDLLLLDVVRDRFEGPDHVPNMQAAFHKWHPYAIFVEQAGFQLSTIQTASRAFLPVVPVLADRDKLTRALPAAARMKAEGYFFPLGNRFVDEETELWSFPAGANDDFVDTVSLSTFAVDGFGSAGTLE